MKGLNTRIKLNINHVIEGKVEYGKGVMDRGICYGT